GDVHRRHRRERGRGLVVDGGPRGHAATARARSIRADRSRAALGPRRHDRGRPRARPRRYSSQAPRTAPRGQDRAIPGHARGRGAERRRSAPPGMARRARRDLRPRTAARVAEFTRWSRLGAPEWIGAPPPPAVAGGPAASRVDLGYKVAQEDARILRGVPASGGVVRGPARLVLTMD